MINKRAVRRLAGETLRDIGILMLVFFPMDAFFQPAPLAFVTLAPVLGLALSCIVVGIIFESTE
jgi:hypothetical protein